MTGHSIYENIRHAYGTSTQNNNRYERAIYAVDWDCHFFADDEHYFIKGDMTFTTPSLDPFKITRDWRPCFVFADASMIYL